MERVSIVEGAQPVILVAPHGADTDDTYTGVIAETAAEFLNAYAVINNGWERADEVDYYKDKANCNNIRHCLEDVVKDEFFDPIIRFKNRIRKKHAWGYMFTIHGVGNDIRTKANDPDLSVVIGYGAGSPPSHTCLTWMKDYLIYIFDAQGVKAYGGKGGGNYAGWAKTNLNQLFNKWPKYDDNHMHSMQLEFVRAIRNDRTMAEYTGVVLADVIGELIQKEKWVAPAGFTTKEI